MEGEIVTDEQKQLFLMLDLWELEDVVKQSFENAFGKGIVEQVGVRKYPSNYGIVVWVKKKELEPMFHLANQIEKEYRRHGFRVQVAVEEVTTSEETGKQVSG